MILTHRHCTLVVQWAYMLCKEVVLHHLAAHDRHMNVDCIHVLSRDNNHPSPCGGSLYLLQAEAAQRWSLKTSHVSGSVTFASPLTHCHTLKPIVPN